ncbi:MAG: hypothetical protein IT300_02120 [Dehalococcoidia bacterium]|nr:hypothetical protein [Dehalococcoidia bacterium]
MKNGTTTLRLTAGATSGLIIGVSTALTGEVILAQLPIPGDLPRWIGLFAALIASFVVGVQLSPGDDDDDGTPELSPSSSGISDPQPPLA